MGLCAMLSIAWRPP